MSERFVPTPAEITNKKQDNPNVVLAREGRLFHLLRLLKINVELDFLMLRINLLIDHEKAKALDVFIKDEKPGHLIFAVNNHTTDIDGITLVKVLEERFPALSGKLAFVVAADRWSKPENRRELDEHVGSYILLNRQMTRENFEMGLNDIKAAAMAGYAIVIFVEGTRDDAEEKDFAISIEEWLEDKNKTADETKGVMIADVSLEGLKGVYPKVPEGQEGELRKKLVKKRFDHVFPPAMWHKPGSWRDVKVLVNDIKISRDENGEKVSRGKIKRWFQSLKEMRHSRNSLEATPPPTDEPQSESQD